MNGSRLFVRLGLLTAIVALGVALVATEPLNLAIGSWQPTGSLAGERAASAAVVLDDGRILYTGGADAAGPVFDAETFDPLSGSFSGVEPMGTARSGHSAVRLTNGAVLVAGGWTAGGVASGSAEIFDPDAGSWSDAGTMLEPRAGHTATLLADGRVLLAGGTDADRVLSTVEIFDPASGTFAAWGELAGPRTQHAAARLADGRVLIVGGSDGAGSLASSEIFAPGADTLADGPSLSVPRAGLSATRLLDGGVLVAGGGDGATELASAEIYDVEHGAFVPLAAALGQARRDHLAFLLPANNGVLIVGGSAAGVSLSSAELYRPWSESFAATGGLAAARSGAAGAAWEGGAVVAGGDGIATSESYGFATLWTDKDDYAPGETVTITGSGWQPGEAVDLWLREAPHPLAHEDLYLVAVADGNGDIFNDEFAPETHDADVRFYLTAFGSSSEAQTTFTDSPKVGSVTVAAQSPDPVIAGSSATYVITVNRGSGAGSTGSFSASLSVTTALPAGASASFSPNPVSFTGGQSSRTSTLTITTSAATPSGSTAFTVRAEVVGTPADNASGSGTLSVSRRSTSTGVSLSPASVNVGQASTVTVTVSDTAAGPKAFPSGTVALSSSVAGDVFGAACALAPTATPGVSTCSSSVTPASASVHTITASYPVTGVHAASSGSAGLTVSKIDQTITFGALEAKTFGDAPFAVGATASSGLTVSFSSLTAPVCTVAGTTVTLGAAGTCTLRASQAGNATYNPAPDVDQAFTVAKATPTATLQVDNSPQTFDGTARAAAVSVTASSVPGTVVNVLTGGAANQTGAGTYPVTADFVPDDSANYNSLTGLAAGDFLIGKAATVTTVTCPAGPFAYTGAPHEPCSAAVTGPGGLSEALTVSYADNVDAGLASASASYPESANYLGSDDSESFTIDKAATVTTVTCPAGPFVYNGAPHEPCTAAVTGPGGLDQALTVSYTNNVDAGLASASASYPESANYLGSNDSKSFTISAADTATAITNAAALASTPTVVGESYAVAWAVTAVAPGGGTPTGTVTVSGGSGCSAPAAAGTCTVTSTTAGSKVLVAAYASDSANFNGSTSAGVTHQVDTRPSSTAVSLSPASIVVGQSSTVTVTVSDSAGVGGASPPTGSVSLGSSVASDVFDSTSCALTPAGPAASSCSVTVTPVSASVHTLSASYAGSSDHSSSGGSAGLTVSPAATTTSVVSAPSPSSFGTLVTFTATVTVDPPGAGTPTGSVTFREGATVLAAGVPLAAGQAAFGISSLTAGGHTITADYSGSSNFTASSGQRAHTVDQAATVSTVSVTPNPQQYSDRVTFVATLSPTLVEGLSPATSVTFRVGSQVMGSVALVENGGVLQGTLAGVALLEPTPFGAPPTGEMAPGARVVTAVFGGVDPNFAVGIPATTLTITREDAHVAYTGADFVSTSCATCSSATVTLAATVHDVSATPGGDPDPGDVRKAVVRFVNRDAGGAVLCSAPVGLASPGNAQVGTATCNWSTTISGDSESVMVGVVVDGYYKRDDSDDNTVVTISKPQNNFITGGGNLVLTHSAGLKAGDPGRKNNWGFNVKYNKSGKNLQGNINAIVRRTEQGALRVFQIKGNAMTSLSVNAPAGTAIFNGKANLQDVTNPANPVPIDGNATLQVTMTDRGEPGSGDTIAITVWDKGGGLWFSSHWNGVKTIEQQLGGGNLVVR